MYTYTQRKHNPPRIPCVERFPYGTHIFTQIFQQLQKCQYYYIWDHFEKYIQISTNIPIIG